MLIIAVEPRTTGLILSQAKVDSEKGTDEHLVDQCVYHSLQLLKFKCQVGSTFFIAYLSGKREGQPSESEWSLQPMDNRKPRGSTSALLAVLNSR
ncbi:hypothetical protein EVAR_92298_1 [Eumeta japonica]|uniref:Uncharacterized protein n=1 Tax=Eumeta variegata TaxID=151549 RepID=A0A4C1TNK6_EUMVA|nr:hypothetical protein EVAR_92298_1 [Eumeta japonica]